MRIVYYVVGWPPDRFANGIVSAIGALAPELRRGGHDVRLIAAYGRPEGPEPDPNVTYIGNQPGDGFHPIRALRDRLNPYHDVFEEAPRRIAEALAGAPALGAADVVELEESFGWSAIVAKRISAPVVTRLHGPHFLTGGAVARSAYDAERIRREGAAIGAAAGVTAPSRFVLDAVRNRYDVPLERAAVIPNATPLHPAETAWRRTEADPDNILFVGRFDAIKGADIALRAFAKLAAARPALTLTFAGPCDDALSVAGRRRTKDEFLAEEIDPDAARRIAFLGRVAPAGIVALRRRAAATLVASRVEMFPNVVLEALALGSPLAATAVGGIPEIAQDGVEALLAPPEDADALARAIATLLDEPERAERLGRAGRARVEAAFAPARVADLAAAYYADVAARGKARGTRAGKRAP